MCEARTRPSTLQLGIAVVLVTAIALLLNPAPARAQGGGSPGGQAVGHADLAKQLSNPLASLVSVPFQFNWATPVGPNDDTRLILNIQPVMPFDVSENWNMITRMIVPIIGQPPLVEGGEGASGIGDVLTSFFFSPKSTEPFIWGVGPVISIPSTSEATLGSGKWSAGPTAVVLKQSGGFTYGVLFNQVWSMGGATGRSDVSQLFLQPFLAYTTPSALTLTINSESIANWKAGTDKWTVPINFLAAKVATFGPFPASYQLGVGVYVAKPETAPDWQLRATITLLLPKSNG
jgi:hypothetical protein